jgi:hypothetical protein
VLNGKCKVNNINTYIFQFHDTIRRCIRDDDRFLDVFYTSFAAIQIEMTRFSAVLLPNQPQTFVNQMSVLAVIWVLVIALRQRPESDNYY